MSQETVLNGLGRTHRVTRLLTSAVDAWLIAGDNDEGTVYFEKNRVAAVTQNIGGTYTNASTIAFAQDLYRLLRLHGQPTLEGKRVINLNIIIPGHGSGENIDFQIARGKKVSVNLILPDASTRAPRSVTLTTFRNVP